MTLPVHTPAPHTAASRSGAQAWRTPRPGAGNARRHRLHALGLLAWLTAVASCADSSQVAILELTLQPPDNLSAELQELQVQLRPATLFPFEQAWVGDDLTLDLRTTPEPFRISLVSEEAPIAVHLRLRYCNDCSGNATGAVVRELRFAFENPFYIGSRTEWQPDAALIDPARNDGQIPVDIGRCDIRGCISGDALSSYCDAEGRHFCE